MYRFWLKRKVCESSCTRVANARCLFRRTPISEDISPALLRSMLEELTSSPGSTEGRAREGKAREGKAREEREPGENE